MHTSFFSDIIARKPALFRAMLAFNGRLGSAAPDCPEEWRVPGLDTAVVAAELSLRGSPVLAWPVAPPEEGFWDFTDESRRLAFLSAEELERLGKVFGVCVHAAELARIITREPVLALREALGEPLYRYGIQRGQYQLGSVRQFFLSRDVREPLLERMQRHGRLAIAICRAPWPTALKERAAENLEDAPPSVAPGDTVTPSAGTRVLKASETAVLLEANAVLDAARERVADMERKAGEAYERRREEGYRDGVEEGRLEHAEKVMETVLSSVEYIEGIEATLVNVVAVAVRKVIGEIDENERIVRIVRNALVTVRNQQHVTIRVAPADEKAVREGLASMLASVPGGASFLDVVPDARLERGACLLESELGVVDASLETQLKALENALRSKIAS